MPKKVFRLAIGLVFFNIFLFKCFLTGGAAVTAKSVSSRYGGNSATGNITFEVEKPSDFYKAVQKIAAKYEVTTVNYNTYVDTRSKKQRISISYKLNISKSAEFISELTSLGNVKSQNYYDNNRRSYGEDAESKLSNLEKEKEKYLSSLKSTPLTIGLIDREIQNLTNQINSQKASLDVASISVTIEETDQDNIQPDKKEEPKKMNYFNLISFVLSLIIILLLILNIFINKKLLRKCCP